MQGTFRNGKLDGYTRYRAVVRLLYIYYNYRQFDEMYKVMQELDQSLRAPAMYSKRILANYYANRAMMHQKRRELELAEKYGYLSVRQRNSDYLFYVNTLGGILLKQKKYPEALGLMQETLGKLQHTNSFYNRIGFVALYLRTLTASGQAARAESYGETFSQVYRHEILEHRWHAFYKAYLQTLLVQRNYRKLLTMIRRNGLLERERKYLGKARYLPGIQWYYWVAAYLEAETGPEATLEHLLQSLREMKKNQHKTKKINELVEEVQPHIPDLVNKLRDKG